MDVGGSLDVHAVDIPLFLNSLIDIFAECLLVSLSLLQLREYTSGSYLLNDPSGTPKIK